MKKYILSGLIILLPIAITIWIARFFFDILTTPFMGLIELTLDQQGIATAGHPGLVFACRLLILILIFFLIFLIGFVAQRLFFNWLIKLADRLFMRIPVIKSIYKIAVEIIKSLLSPGAKPFKKTVMLDFPDKDSKALGFYTGDVPEQVAKGDNLKTIFLPTAPHPISGFLLISPEKALKDVDISIEDVFKILVSCGTYRPGEDQPPTSTKDADSKAD